MRMLLLNNTEIHYETVSVNRIILRVFCFFFLDLFQKEIATLLLQKHSECLSQLILPTKIVRMLYTEEVISMEILNEMERSGGLRTDHSLRALSNTVSEDPNKLRILTNVLLQSEETVHVGQVILKEYSK